ncbi:FMN-binding protein [Urechidicola croceus]|uniref:FMN-binding protein n=1 Tax=Urechidicola croceus TaxID=1850246 RepID=A0A1D8P4Z0_9FLAO|nr:FMN-binding protein [Urechidicola croceus]AOW19650.1 FMN-binding protein [Urechidicola croceus]
MKIKVLFFLVCISLATVFMSFELPKNLLKKVDKEIKTVYTLENYTLENVLISDEINATLATKIEENNLFKIFKDSTLVGYAFVDKAPSKTDEFDYLVLFDTEFIITKSKVLTYHEDYGSEIGSKRWLKQFIGKNKDVELQYGKDIIAISGATISARSMTVAINNLLKSITILNQQQII